MSRVSLGYGHGPLRELKPSDFGKKQSMRLMRSNVVLPSQHQSYSVCTEFAKEWFIEKFREHFFNSIYVDGSHSFDEFRKFSSMNQQIKRANPMLAIVPSIDMAHNRSWVDSTPEIPTLLRRSRIDGTFFNDINNPKQLHLQLLFKTVLMNFTYKIRLDTRAEQLDMAEFIKMHHRGGWTETRELSLDIHVPKAIITQIAFDNGFDLDNSGNPTDSVNMLSYLNSHSLIPFIYKLRCSNGNNEYFIKVPNCIAHIKSELPTVDDGERQDHLTNNYIVEFQIEVEMTAPYCYTYFSQAEQEFICGKPVADNSDAIACMMAIRTEVPSKDDHGWALFVTTEYLVDNEDLKKPLTIDFREFFENTELGDIINYTRSIAVNPAVFINFIFLNNGIPQKYMVDWNTMQCRLPKPIENITTVIGIYCDLAYLNNTQIHLKELNNNSSRIE